MDFKNIKRPLSLENIQVQKVIEIAKELIEQNKVLKIKTLYDKAIKSLDIPGSAILEILEVLTNKKILIDGSKHTRDTILFNLYRKRIYKVINEQKGATFSFLRETIFTQSSGSAGQLLWHLKMLLKFNYIKKIKIGNYSVFLPIEMEDDLGKLHFYMKDELNRKIIELLLHNNKITKTTIYKKINFKRENVNYRLKILLENNILRYYDELKKEISISPYMKNYLLIKNFNK
ncbi:MAG: hypothetical protein ACFFBP_08920 [Promethearchaeota archaeon]